MAEPSAGSDEPADQRERGSLDIRDKVIDKIATYAALDVHGVVRHASGFGRVTGRDLPRVRSTITRGHLSARVDIAVVWPLPLTTTTADVRSRVADRVGALTGLTVDSVAVSVEALVPASSVETNSRRIS